MDKLKFELHDNQKIFFTSDLHFGHRNVLNFCHRPFSSTTEMGQTLIENWNSKVTDEDYVFILGDVFWFHSRHDTKKIMSKLKGKGIYIVPGNHCKKQDYELCDDRIKIIDDISVLYIKRNNISRISEVIVSHYPLMTWPHRINGSYNFFGHIHSGPNVDHEYDNDLPLWEGLQYDVGVDNNEYFPISFEEILEKLKGTK